MPTRSQNRLTHLKTVLLVTITLLALNIPLFALAVTAPGGLTLNNIPIATASSSPYTIGNSNDTIDGSGDLTSFYNLNYHFLTRRTMVFSLGPSILNTVVQARGPVVFTGGAGAYSQ